MKKLDTKYAEAREEVSLERTLDLIRRLIKKLEEQINVPEAKGTVGDYIKLLQLQKELEQRRIRRIEVKWVDDV